TERFEAAWPFWDDDRQDGLALLPEFGTFRDVPQTIEVHIGPGRHGDQRGVVEFLPGHVRLGTGNAEGACRLENRARIFEHVFDRGTDGIRIHHHHIVHQFLTESERLDPHRFYRHAVSK